MVFTGGMLWSSYNQIKTTLDAMTSNSQEWRVDEFGSRNESIGSRRGRGRIDEGSEGNVTLTL